MAPRRCHDRFAGDMLSFLRAIPLLAATGSGDKVKTSQRRSARPGVRENLPMPINPDQGEFDFDHGHENGLDNVAQILGEQRKKISRIYDVPLGRKVCVQLKTVDRELSGILALARAPAILDPRLPLALRIGHAEFLRSDIASCVIIA
jgi:hypothetical protein